MKLPRWLARLFEPTVTTTYTASTMTPEQRAAFDRGFAKMDEAFAELRKVFER